MNTTQIKNIITNGENEEVEFKESLHSTQEIAKTLCSFANTNGGILLFGVKDNGTIIGVSGNIDKVQQSISATIQTIHPTPNSSIRVCSIENKNVIMVTIQKSDIDSFYSTSGGIYVRIGSTIKKLEAPEMAEFLKSKKVLCFDETISDAKIEQIDEAKIEEYLKLRNQGDFLKTKSIEEFLISSNLARKNGKLLIKSSAVLIFGKEPCKIIPQAELKLVKFSGKEAIDIASYQLLQTTLPEQIESALAFIKKNINHEIIIGSDSKRIDKHEYPPAVLREGIINAIVHRDYFSKDSIQVNIFDNRLEITSPGTIPTGLTKALLGSLSVQRNPLLYRFLRDFGYVEGLGTGIPRMINEMRKHGLSDPVFDISPSFFRLILKNKKAAVEPIESIKDLNERQKTGLVYVLKHKSIKAEIYGKINSVSKATAINEINEMIKFKYLKKIGAFRSAYYVFGDKLQDI